jgi:hypothetical protein
LHKYAEGHEIKGTGVGNEEEERPEALVQKDLETTLKVQ